MVTYKQSPSCRECQLAVLSLPKTHIQRDSGELPDIHRISTIPTIAIGAQMKPEIAHVDWLTRKAPVDISRLKLPKKEDISASLWMPQASMSDARDYISYECHDIRIGMVCPHSGQLLIMYCERVEPHKNPESLRTELAPIDSSIETAPINGFYWPIGGRRMCPKPGTPLDGKFSIYHSALLKANQEANIETQNVLGIYDLGIGKTEFPRDMRYLSHSIFQEESFATIRDVHMPNAQRTVNYNLIILVDKLDLRGDKSVKDFKFLTEGDLQSSSVKAKFSLYEQSFLHAIFEGWETFKGFRPSQR